MGSTPFEASKGRIASRPGDGPTAMRPWFKSSKIRFPTSRPLCKVDAMTPTGPVETHPLQNTPRTQRIIANYGI